MKKTLALLLSAAITFSMTPTAWAASAPAEDASAAEDTSAAEDASPAEDASAPEAQADAAETPDAAAVETRAQEIVSSMSVQEKICQMIMPAARKWSDTPDDEESFENITALNDQLKEFFSEYNFAGICLFGENSVGTEQLVKLTDEIKTAAAQTDKAIPMFISIDQEGGYVVRLATGTTGIGNMALAATQNPENAKINAEIIGSELQAEGVNMNFGPVVDVNNNPNNPIIGVRSFSDNPDTVAEFAIEYTNGLEEYNIISCLKHFPGHGDTATDSHTGFPTIDKSYEELQKLELIPFRAVSEYAEGIMTAHIQYPQIETETYTSTSTGEEVYLPATLSKTIITDILRGDMGYDGVVFTDSLLMDAIAQNFDLMDASVYAINADVDVILMPYDLTSSDTISQMKDYIKKLVEKVESGEIDESQLDDSVTRIIKQKLKSGLFTTDETPIDEKVDNALTIVGSEEHHNTEWNLATQAITLESGSLDGTKEALADNNSVCIVSARDGYENSVTFAVSKLENVDDLNVKFISYDGIEKDNSADYADDISNAGLVIVITNTYSLDELDTSNEENVKAIFATNIINMAKDAGKKVISISAGLPYDATAYSMADAVLLAYNPAVMATLPTEYNGETARYAANVPAAIYTALGGCRPTGQCPVKLPE